MTLTQCDSEENKPLIECFLHSVDEKYLIINVERGVATMLFKENMFDQPLYEIGDPNALIKGKSILAFARNSRTVKDLLGMGVGINGPFVIDMFREGHSGPFDIISMNLLINKGIHLWRIVPTIIAAKNEQLLDGVWSDIEWDRCDEFLVYPLEVAVQTSIELAIRIVNSGANPQFATHGFSLRCWSLATLTGLGATVANIPASAIANMMHEMNAGTTVEKPLNVRQAVLRLLSLGVETNDSCLITSDPVIANALKKKGHSAFRKIVVDGKETTALQQIRHPNMFRVVVDDVEEHDELGMSPLEAAIQSDIPLAVRELLEMCADVALVRKQISDKASPEVRGMVTSFDLSLP